jgi:cytidylate kinase
MTSIDTIINRQLLRWEQERQRAQAQPSPAKIAIPPIVTISRQTGSRGSYFGSRLAQKLGYQRLHREVIDAIVHESGYFRRVIESLDENFRGSLELMVEGMITGQSVDHRDYFGSLCKVVLSMSELGGVVLMGRGGNFILGPSRGFHIRFVCPFETRVQNVMKYLDYSEREAFERVKRSDQERHDFMKKLFHADIDDPTRYDMVVNSERMDVEDLLPVVIAAMQAKMNKLENVKEEGE